MPGLDARLFEIHISHRSPDGSYNVTVRVPAEGRRADGIFRLPYSDTELNRALGWMEQGLFDAGYAREFGTGLFEALFTGDVRDVYEGSRQSGARLRFRLVIDVPSLTVVPWELLYDPAREIFLALDGSVVRDVSLRHPTLPLDGASCLRILVVDASPKGLGRLQGQVEATQIRAALARLIRARRVEVVTISGITLRALQNALREAANASPARPFHLLHFIGHGSSDGASGETTLLFEDDDGQPDPVSPETLATILSPYQLKAVFLNACESMRSSALDLARGFAPALMACGIPAVLGMQVTVLDDLARQFSRDFYAALADNQPIDVAIADARQLARGSRRRRKADLGVPVCYLRTESGRILHVRSDGPSLAFYPTTWWPWVRRQVTPRALRNMVIGLIGLTASLIAIVEVAGPYVRNRVCDSIPLSASTLSERRRFCGLTSMSMHFVSVAVADIGETDNSGRARSSKAGRELADHVHDSLEGELTQIAERVGKRVDMRRPSVVGRIRGDTEQAQANETQSVADKINADIVIYGMIMPQGDSNASVLRLHISPHFIRGAEELAGSTKYGAPVGTPRLSDKKSGIATSPDDVDRQVRERTASLARFIYGLSSYKYGLETNERRAFEEAAQWFAEAASISQRTRQQGEGKEVIYLFQGNTALMLGDSQSARAHYERAKETNHDYARARYGIGEALLVQNAGSCVDRQSGPDLQQLNDALESYNAADKVPDQPTGPAGEIFRLKTILGRGRTHLCLALAGQYNHRDEAEKELKKVTDHYELRGNDANATIMELAVVAYGARGLLYMPTPSAPEREMHYSRAAQMFERAIALSREREQHNDPPPPKSLEIGRARNYAWLAVTHYSLAPIRRAHDSEQRDCEKADQALTKATSSYKGYRKGGDAVQSLEQLLSNVNEVKVAAGCHRG